MYMGWFPCWISSSKDFSKKKSAYSYGYFKEMQDIVNRIKEEYPLVNFQVWEFVQLNEFVNHQIGKMYFS